jgi:hypothetical protein
MEWSILYQKDPSVQPMDTQEMSILVPAQLHHPMFPMYQDPSTSVAHGEFQKNRPKNQQDLKEEKALIEEGIILALCQFQEDQRNHRAMDTKDEEKKN